MSPSSRRAWIEISVVRLSEQELRSPSSRRAWIEMRASRKTKTALSSPSSRRAWIKMPKTGDAAKPDSVALLAEGVDRNFV